MPPENEVGPRGNNTPEGTDNIISLTGNHHQTGYRHSIGRQGLRDELTALAAVRAAERAGPVTPGLLLACAIIYVLHGWEVFPLRGKAPAIRGGHGVLDATDDVATICRWWAGEYVGANVGVRVPDGVFVLDTDPRKDGHAAAAAALIEAHGDLPRTLTHLSGRMDGGMHRFYRHPGGKLTAKQLGLGFDIKDSSGYVVAPPSVHPDTGGSYVELLDMPIADCGWLAPLIAVPPAPVPAHRETRSSASSFFADSFFGPPVAVAFNGSHTWAEVLEPHGWRCRGGHPDADGAVWLHPAATSDCSATVRDGRLYVYSTSTAFEVTEPGSPKGHSKFDAYTVLNFGGDASAAARSLRKVG